MSVAAMISVSMAVSAFAGPAEPEPEVRAQITPKRYTTLSSEIPARIERIPAKEGERFRQGDLLVALDCSLQRAQAEEARAALAAADKTKSVNRRLLQLGSGGALEADVSAAEAAKAQAHLQSALVILSKCSIAAPFPGRIVEQKVREVLKIAQYVYVLRNGRVSYNGSAEPLKDEAELRKVYL